MSKVYTIKSNARRAARQQGLDPEEAVIAVDGGFAVITPKAEMVNPLEPTPAEVRAEAEKQICAAADKPEDDGLDIPAALRRPMPTGDELIAYRSRLDEISKHVSPDRPLVLRAVDKKKAARASKERRPSKIDEVLALAKSETGVTVEQVHQMTGWTKIGGFYTALKKSGMKIEKKREGKVTTYFLKAAA